ncbi:hypothetical protein LHV13_00065 [Ferrovum sp. PN-J185]|uniref:hypothetical protein n=1 Tax=Ferrovum sp. PN-J185 TaxID=1356306 RepID=UPI0007943BAA|nr:hypothetical protein [Ferrovum sp. PN-J185]KXW56733.1 hypothetical protein FV185_06920 [Ferrovum sp. PN-J185]MCC6067582.1 hypothetical protein [Ferrovum sp. PN-J185]MDE2056493.1 hypothetical protein [Betaproteobacteria bacterium]
MTRLVLLLILNLFIVNIYAESVGGFSGISIPNLYLSNDSEGLNISKIGGGFYPQYSDPGHFVGISYQNNHYSQNSWSKTANQYGLIYNNYNLKDWSGYNINLNVNNLNGSHLLVTDSQINFKINTTTNTQLLVNRDRIETQPSLDSGIFYTLSGVSLEHQFIKRLSLVGLLGMMDISDGNKRWLVKAKLIYDLFPNQGVNLQLRYRQFRDTNTQLPNNYFNPDYYSESLAGLGIRQHLSGWVISGFAGVGRQYVTGTPSTVTKLIEGSVDSPVYSRIFFRARAGCSNAGEFQGPNYSYRYWMNEFIFSY